ncbi:hypothetical protein PIIN_04512 [Serendipita indica DSM 11827]|uniref:DUF6699 domain-containing protein n=1 Tax=Serendipita indica (strain DSM 11827) TaxID=1109443 RepID=G4TGY1_SERID|nr:hypothetical protein PIIN_04512 [Serendipita indica DSM 11827]
MTDKVGKWLEGSAYGPVMKQTDIFLLGVTLTVNPVLTGDHPDIRINFNVSTGDITAQNPKDDKEEPPWEPYQEQPAVLPRCTTLYIICRQTPWCIHIENRTGVTVKDVFTSLYAFHSNEFITEDEWNALPPKTQDRIKRMARQDGNLGGPVPQTPGQWSYYHQSPNPTSVRFARKAWLQSRVNLDDLKVDDEYCEQRLGYKGPNVLVMTLTED